MRRVRWVPRVLGVMSLGAGLQALGCWPLDYTEDGAAGGQSGNGGSGGSTVVPGCIPSVNPAVSVEESCGVFVNRDAGGAAPAGTKKDPFKALSDAIEAVKGREKGKRNIYLCAQEFTGAVTLPAGVRLYSGFLCAQSESDWHYQDRNRATLSAPAGEIPLTILGGDDESALEDVNVVAEAATEPSGSSIAVMVNEATVSLVRCDIKADTARDAEPWPNFGMPEAPASVGNSGGTACSDPSSVRGGGEKPSACDLASVGGVGGTGNPSSGSPGGAGLPGGATNTGGVGEAAGVLCAKGGDGDAGESGVNGTGFRTIGGIDATGYVGGTGGTGGIGGAGKGGGGGGGSKGGTGGTKCPGAMPAGAGGGSGGPGGCGGAGGNGGRPGGSSIALISLDSSIRFDAVLLQSRNAGNGGTGGRGQEGGDGGAGGPGGSRPVSATALNTGCAGGHGGKGGSGGDGGSGPGGHSLGIAFTGKAPSLQSATVETGTFGAGGSAVNPDFMDGKGVDGRKAPTLKFD